MNKQPQAPKPQPQPAPQQDAETTLDNIYRATRSWNMPADQHDLVAMMYNIAKGALAQLRQPQGE